VGDHGLHARDLITASASGLRAASGDGKLTDSPRAALPLALPPRPAAAAARPA
jgi:hypothetical protein